MCYGHGFLSKTFLGRISHFFEISLFPKHHCWSKGCIILLRKNIFAVQKQCNFQTSILKSTSPTSPQPLKVHPPFTKKKRPLFLLVHAERSRGSWPSGATGSYDPRYLGTSLAGSRKVQNNPRFRQQIDSPETSRSKSSSWNGEFFNILNISDVSSLIF